jgi:hypothetical protein|tara:strand:- start:1301 stop:1564 length:264 start_codon:yes stop_codon:yes gene_type:complete
MAEEKIFADGFIFKKDEQSPEFVIGKISVKVDEAISFLKQNASSGWVNLDVKLSQGGKYYMELDTWKPTKKKESVANSNEGDDDMPF